MMMSLGYLGVMTKRERERTEGREGEVRGIGRKRRGGREDEHGRESREERRYLEERV